MRKLILWAGLFTASNVTQFGQEATQSKYQDDPRRVRLAEFFAALGSPLEYLTADFLRAADHHALDWRLLPSICVIESGAGKNYTKNNIFGWDSARKGFTSVRDGIYWVASRIAHSKLYRGKTLDEILATYNPRADYPARVKQVMRQVDPREPARARGTAEARVSPVAELRSTDRPAPAP